MRPDSVDSAKHELQKILPEAPTRTRSPLPSELLHKIILIVVTESIHDICLVAAIPQWNMKVIYSLSTTCFTFREIMGDIMGKAFAITVSSTSDGVKGRNEHRSELFCIAQTKITCLRTLGVHSREPFPNTESPSTLSNQANCALIRTYALYLKASALRLHISQNSTGEVYTLAHKTILKGLEAGLRVSEEIKPSGLAKLVKAALLKEISLVKLETCLIKRRIDLENSVANFQRVLCGATPPAVEDKQRHLNDIKTDIHAAFQEIEDVSIKPHNDSHVKADEVRHALQLSGVMITVKECERLHLEMDEYDLKERAGILVEQWG